MVGVTALLLASKYEEMYTPEVADFVYITDNAYTAAQIREMEMLMLRELNFDLGRPLPLHFLRRASKSCSVSLQEPGDKRIGGQIWHLNFLFYMAKQGIDLKSHVQHELWKENWNFSLQNSILVSAKA